ncbi:MAG: hypothetical protein HGB19_09130 [Chlorobiales bacterium]|jgi:ribosome maturation factor RimP|nr:hypothetical protein [Chlorobiales bacterium]
MSKSGEIIRAWISDIVTKTPLVTKSGEIQEYYLVDVEVHSNSDQTIVAVYVDTDKGISIENCRYLSKRIAEALETDEKIQQVLHDRYRLDVSSPGVSRPIVLPRQYVKNVGRRLQVTYEDGSGEVKTAEGRLVSETVFDSTDQAICLDLKKEVKGRPNKKPSAPELLTVPLKQIKQAIVQIEL